MDNALQELQENLPVRVSPELLQVLSQLNERMRLLVFNYIAGAEEVRGNMTQSAIAAGYSKRSAHTTASKLFNEHPKVMKAVELLREEAATLVQLDLTKYIELLLQQANAWLDPKTGRPLLEPKVQQGAVVTMPLRTRNENGEVVDRNVPVIERARPNSANVRALQHVGTALGILQAEKTKEGVTVNGNVLIANVKRDSPVEPDEPHLYAEWLEQFERAREQVQDVEIIDDGSDDEE